MSKYIGTKIVEAKPSCRLHGPGGSFWVSEEHVAEVPAWVAVEDGYEVRYADGYTSWSPKKVFEEAYRPTDGLPFGLAIEAAKKGRKIQRAGWNGKGQYVELATGISCTNAAGDIVNVKHEAIGNAALAFVGTSGVQIGWLASQADMLADDWRIVDGL